MPLINVQPMTMQNGDRVTTYTNTVAPTQETFTFLTSQETVILRNKGSKNITYTIGAQSGTLGRSESVKVSGAITSFDLTASQGTQAFEIWADETGSTAVGGSDSRVDALILKVAELESQGGGGGTIPTFATLSDLQTAYPTGVSYPAWISSENAWYYWSGELTPPDEGEPSAGDTTAPVLTITPATTFTDTQTVTMSTNETATIWYTLDDSDPKTSGTKLTYSNPLTLTETDTIKAYARDTAGNESVVQTVTYTKEAAPTGTHVNDASLLFFKNSGITNGETIPNAENYFNETEEFTLSVTFQPVVSGSNAANLLVSRFLMGGTDNVMKLEWNWNDTILGNLYGTKADGTTAWNPQGTTPAYTDKTKYYHIVFKRQGTALTIHVDNTQVASTTILTTDLVRQVSAQSLKIGQSGKVGLFKNVAYYNRALTSGELTQNYNALK